VTTAAVDDVKLVVADWISGKVVGGRPIDEHHPLLESGTLTSMDTLELVLFLEERFAITVMDDDFVQENFASIADIARFVTAKTA
jgi:acyl carrier protein